MRSECLEVKRGTKHMEEVKVSVVVSIYNAEKYLRQCIDSIVGQSFRDIQIILVDDGSTDGSGTVCDEYAEVDIPMGST